MRKNTIYLAIFLILSLLLFTSCKPAGKAIAGVPVSPADLTGYPRNVVKLDDFNDKVQFNIKADTQYSLEVNALSEKVMTELCQLAPDTCNYNPELTTDDTSFIAIGTCDDVGQYLDESLCPLSQGKAIIQYVDNYKLVVAGGTPADVQAGLGILMNHNNWLLSGFYSDIINTDKIVAASHLTGTNSIEYVEKFYFTQGTNKITNPLKLPAAKQSLTNFFLTVSDKINTVYYYDSTTDSYTGVYNGADTSIPSNLVHFGVTDDTYIVDANADFSVTVIDAEHPTQTTLAGIGSIDPAYTQDVVSAFMTGASVYGMPVQQSNLITGGAIAGQTTPPDTKAIYRCYYNFHGVVNHFLTDQADCGRDDSTNAGQVGYVYTLQKPDTVPLYQCYRAVRYERPGHEKRTYHDHFTSYDSNCEGNSMDGLLGYVPQTLTANTEAWYRCLLIGGIRDAKYDHTISTNIACDSSDWRNEGQSYNFLKTEETSLPPWDNGHLCDQDTQCNSNYCAPDTNVCEPIVIPIYRCHYTAWGVINHFLTEAADCGREDSTSDGIIGYLIQPALGNTVPIVQCYRQIRTDRPGHEKHTYTDHFITTNACPADTTYEATLGNALVTSTTDTETVYRCWASESINSGRYDHMASTAMDCESSDYRNEGAEYYFLKTDQLPAALPPAPAGPETKAIYRCHYTAWGVINHFMTDQADCGRDDSTSDGLFGYLYTSQKPDTVPLYQCYRAIRTERPGHEKHTYQDNYQTTDSNCEGAGTFEGLLGYAPESAVADTIPAYRCWASESINAGRYNHMLSKELNCEDPNYRNEGVVYNFLTTDTPTTGPPWPNGHNCTADVDCTSGYCDTSTNLCTPEPGTPDISIGITDNPDPVNANGTLDYDITLSNTGTVNITGATLLVTYPSEVQYLTDDLPLTQVSTTQWTFGISAGDAYTGTISVQVDANVINNTPIILTLEVIVGGETISETETTTVISSTGLPAPGVPPLVPPPSPPATPPLPHQFYGIVNNGVAGMPILATMSGMSFNTTVDSTIMYGYTPLFLVTGSANGTIMQFFVNNSYDQNATFQQGTLTRLDLTYTPGGTPPVGPSCTDNILNQDETDVDCGGTVCSKCPNGDMCNVNRDCRSLKCTNGICVKKPTVAVGGGGGGGGSAARDFYGTQQPEEPTTGPECFDDWICDPWGPCVDGFKARECFLNDYPECVLELPKPSTEQICEFESAPIEAPSCFDGIKNQDETYRDCGGSMCKPCDPNLPCRTGMDCMTGYCNPLTELCGWPPTEDVVEEVPKATSYLWLWVLLGLIVIGGGGATYYFLTHKEGGIPESQRLKDLKAYVAKFTKKNVPREKLKDKLRGAGWKKEDIDQVLK